MTTMHFNNIWRGPISVSETGPGTEKPNVRNDNFQIHRRKEQWESYIGFRPATAYRCPRNADARN
jgi:hypothetical protein